MEQARNMPLRLLPLLIAVILLACGGDNEAPAVQPTTAATQPPPAVVLPTPPAQTADLARSFREFLPQVDAALQRRDAEFFATRALPRPVTCDAQMVRSILRIGGCTRVGEQFQGIDVALWRSDQRSPVPVGAAAGLLLSLWNQIVPGRDEFGDASARVYAMSVTPNAPEGAPQAAAVLTSMVQNPTGPSPKRVALVTHWRLSEGQWRYMLILDATTALAEDFLRPTAEGRMYLGNWERYQP